MPRLTKSHLLDTLARQRRLKVPRARSGATRVIPPPRQGVETPAVAIKRKGEWKRRQGGQTFLDHLLVNVRGGKGGDGCVAFHREKFKPYGPPSGGNGGRGGDIYFRPLEGLTSLSGIPKRIRAGPGSNGQGTWRHGRVGNDVVIDVPVGTVVREVVDSRRQMTPEEAEEHELEGLSDEERKAAQRTRRWVHYPMYEGDNLERKEFHQAEQAVKREENALRRMKKYEKAAAGPIFMDFDKPYVGDGLGHLIARGGTGGFGNPFFHSTDNRSPKFATRGSQGDWITLELELKLLADIGLVGLPNAGKSTLLRALTNSKAEVAPYAFTTLNPQIGTMRVWDDGKFGDGVHLEAGVQSRVVEDSAIERARLREAMMKGETDSPTQHRGITEAIRFQIADNPGLISGASHNIGLGHSFLKSIERSSVLVYVVDLSGEKPWDDLRIVRDELEAYKLGLSEKGRLVVANKADLLGTEGEEDVKLAKMKLAELEGFAKGFPGRPLAVVPVSAKFSQNLKMIVRLLQQFVSETRNGM